MNYLKGVVVEVERGGVLLMCGDIGYMLMVVGADSLKVNQEYGFYIYRDVRMSRGNALQEVLYGFLVKREWEFFNQLLKIQGIGCKIAWGVLHSDVERVIGFLRVKDHKGLAALSGLNGRVSKMMIMALEDGGEFSGFVNVGRGEEEVEGFENYQSDEVYELLKDLGYGSGDMQKCMKYLEDNRHDFMCLNDAVGGCIRFLANGGSLANDQ